MGLGGALVSRLVGRVLSMKSFFADVVLWRAAVPSAVNLRRLPLSCRCFIKMAVPQVMVDQSQSICSFEDHNNTLLSLVFVVLLATACVELQLPAAVF